MGMSLITHETYIKQKQTKLKEEINKITIIVRNFNVSIMKRDRSPPKSVTEWFDKSYLLTGPKKYIEHLLSTMSGNTFFSSTRILQQKKL